MNYSRNLTLVGIGLGSALAVAASQGCSTSTVTPATGATAGLPPQRPTGAATKSTAEHTYALKTLFMGDTDRDLVLSTTAWRKYGFNLDGKVSTKDSTDLCTPFMSAAKDTQVDGENGIDNAFGSRIVPIIQASVNKEISKTLSDTLAKGTFTVIIDTTGLTEDAKQTNTGLSGQLFAGAKFDGTPSFTTNDHWPVAPNLLSDGKTIAGGSKVKFGDAYVVNGTWVNGAASKVTLTLAFGGVSLDITVNNATIVFDHAGASATNGTIAGVIDTEELITGIQKVAGHLSSSLCAGTAFESIAKQIRQASDIMTDGSNVAGTPCNGISAGIGFVAAEIAPPSVVAPNGVPSPDMCSGTPEADAGADAGAEDSGAIDATPPVDASAG